MFAHVLCFCTAVVGIDVGWQPLQEGGMEYVIQLDPQSLETLKAGEPIESDIPPGAGDVRTYQILLGHGETAADQSAVKIHPVAAGQYGRGRPDAGFKLARNNTTGSNSSLSPYAYTRSGDEAPDRPFRRL